MDKDLTILLNALLKSSNFKINQDKKSFYNQSHIRAHNSDYLDKEYDSFLKNCNDILNIPSNKDEIYTTKTTTAIKTKTKISSTSKPFTTSIKNKTKVTDKRSKYKDHNKLAKVYTDSIIEIVKKRTLSNWLCINSSQSSFLLHTILSSIDEVYSLSKRTQQKKFIQLAREHIAIILGKEHLGSSIKMKAGKQFSVSSLQKYVLDETKFSTKLDNILPYLYSDFFKINLVLVTKHSIIHLNSYNKDHVSILLLKYNSNYYGIIPETDKFNWVNHEIIVKLKEGCFPAFVSQQDKLCEPRKSSSTTKITNKKSTNTFKLRGFYSYNLPELQELSRDFGISIWQIADTREKIYQKNVALKKRKTAKMKTKSKNKTKKQLYEELKDKFNSMKHI